MMSADMGVLDAMQRAMEACTLDLGLPLLVGVSGGADSCCLLDGLARLGWRVIAAHFDHQLRAESGQDAARVARMAADRGLPFMSGSGDVGGVASREGLSIEEAARVARYRFLFAAARQHRAQAVVVGHTADDQVETVLMHLLRGSGLAGLRGMSLSSLQEGWDTQIPLLRPLLNIQRAQTVGYCLNHQIEPFDDPSNADTRFFRNRLRHELIPLLETYNPQFRQTLLRTSDVLREDFAVVEAGVDVAWAACHLASGPGYVCFARADLLGQSAGLLRGLLRRALGHIRPGLRDIGFEDVERAVAFIHQPTRSGAMELSAGLRLFVEDGRMYIEEAGAAPLPMIWPQLTSEGADRLDVPGELELANGWRLSTELVPACAVEWTAGDDRQAWLDADGLVFPLAVRAAREGERFAPLGMAGRSQKLSDLWINLGVARRARGAWPLVCDTQGPLWVVGLRAGHRHRVTPETRELLHLQLIAPLADD